MDDPLSQVRNIAGKMSIVTRFGATANGAFKFYINGGNSSVKLTTDIYWNT